MGVIKETCLGLNTDNDKFMDEVVRKINDYQNKNYDVEVQYSTCIDKRNNIVYSALIIGRIKDN